MLIFLFVVAATCALAGSSVARRLPNDVRVRALATVLLTVLLIVLTGAAPAGLDTSSPWLGGLALVILAVAASLAWRIPGRMQSWATEIGELAMLLAVIVVSATTNAGPAVGAALCIVWAMIGAVLGRRLAVSTSGHRITGSVLALGTLAAALALLGVTPTAGAVVASLVVIVAIVLEHPISPIELGRRVLWAMLGAGAVVTAGVLVGVPLDERALVLATVGGAMVELVPALRHPTAPAQVESVEPDEPVVAFEAERETLAVLGRLADPLAASAEHVLVSLEHVFPGARIELLRNPEAPPGAQRQGASIEPALLAEVCRRGQLRDDTQDPLPRSAGIALRRLGPNTLLLPVTYETHVYGALLVRGAKAREGTLPQVRRFADLLGHRLETQRLFIELQHKQRLATLGTFAAALVHDLRSPLATMRLDMQLVQRAVPPQEREAIADAILALDRVLADLSGTLDFTRPLELDMGTVDVGALVEDVVRSQRAHATVQGVTLQCSLNAPSTVIRGDRPRLVRVLENLVRNALEVSPKGSTVDVSVDATAGGLALRVRDQGPGIDPLLGDRVFEPFVTTKHGGVGLGLAIVRKIIEAHQGHIALERGADVGTCVRVSLPLARGTSPPQL